MATNTVTILQQDSPNEVPVASGFFVDYAGTEDSTRTFNIQAGAGAENLDAGATVNIAGASSNFTVEREGSTLRIIDGNDNITAEILAAPDATSTVDFDDGSAEVAVEGDQITFGGQSFDDGDQVDGSTLVLEDGTPFDVAGNNAGGVDVTVTDDGGVNLDGGIVSNAFPNVTGSDLSGPDNIVGSAGPDTIFSEGGNDSVVGGQSGDLLTVGAGDDTAQGEDGNDTLVGGADNDSLFGGAGNDSINGSQGNDTIDGGAGADQLTGQAGADTFALSAASDSSPNAADTINGFVAGEDTIDLTAISNDLTFTNNITFQNGTLSGPGFAINLEGLQGSLSADDLDGVDPAGGNQAPTVSDASFSVAENATAGTVVGTVQANDSDGTVDNLTITSGNVDINGNNTPAFAINGNGEITVADAADLTANSNNDSFSLTVEATDDDGATGNGTVQVDITAGQTSLDDVTSPFDAGTADFAFTDDASVPNSADPLQINNFGDNQGDTIKISNADDVVFSSPGNDLQLEIVFGKTANTITLADVNQGGGVAFDEDSAEAILGYDAFTVA